MKWKQRWLAGLAVLALCVSLLCGCEEAVGRRVSYDLSDIPAYSGEPYVAVNNNEPLFTDDEKKNDQSFEEYASLDGLGRCGTAYSCVGRELMPTEARGNIGQVKPTGWHSVKYDCVDGKNLYNRCHLIGYQLTAENANDRNLITGTRYLNVEGMLPFENMVADYIQETDNHVLYRVTPIFSGDNLVADGVLMEAYSVEDGGEGVTFCVYAYNVQPGVTIDYATGDSALAGETPTGETDQTGERDYVLNTGTKKFHLPDCASATDMKAANRQEYHGTREALLQQGYAPCGRCKP